MARAARRPSQWTSAGVGWGMSPATIQEENRPMNHRLTIFAVCVLVAVALVLVALGAAGFWEGGLG